PTGAAVPGARVEAKNLDTNFTRSQDSDAGGRFAFLQMPPGRYTVTASKPGFSTIVQENMELTVGQALSLPISMRVSGITEEVTVSAEPIEVTRVESSVTLNELTVTNTPVLGRKFEGLTSNTSDGKPLQDFRREQSGGSIGGPIVRDKAFFFGTFEQIFENLRRDNLSTAIGTPCSISAPVVGVNDTAIAGSADCQRRALTNFFKTRF